MSPKLIFGTASFGMTGSSTFQDVTSVQRLFDTLKDVGITQLDTAARYPPNNPGMSERLIGEAEGDFAIDTKLLTVLTNDGSGDLAKDAMQKSVEESLNKLNAKSVNILYSHRADPSTPLLEQIQNFNDQIQQGRCRYWGVSNTTPEVLQEILKICNEHGLLKPSYYQGSYSLITRGMEAKLLPILRSGGMSYNGYQPLAAGFLTGKFVNNDYKGTRFDESSPIGKIMHSMFSGEQLMEAMKKFDAAVQGKGLTSTEVAYRWLMHHSALNESDGVIIGASRIEQVRESVSKCREGPLPEDILQLTEELWDSVKGPRGEIL